VSLDPLATLRARGLPEERLALLGRLRSGELVGVHAELRALLYLGALLVVFGVGGTVKDHLRDLGPLTIAGLLAAASAGCLLWCARRAEPFVPERWNSPHAAFDYVLYLGCAFLGILFGYLEGRFGLLKDLWDLYLLGSAALFFLLAYRFDNRFVLTMAVFNLAGFLGVRLGRFIHDFELLKWSALGLCAALAGTGVQTARSGLKPHFRDTYLTIAIQGAAVLLLPGVFKDGFAGVDFVFLAALCAASIVFGLSERRFAYLLYGVGFGYLGFSACFLKSLESPGVGFVALYLLGSAAALVVLLLSLRRRMEDA